MVRPQVPGEAGQLGDGRFGVGADDAQPGLELERRRQRLAAGLGEQRVAVEGAAAGPVGHGDVGVLVGPAQFGVGRRRGHRGRTALAVSGVFPGRQGDLAAQGHGVALLARQQVGVVAGRGHRHVVGDPGPAGGDLFLRLDGRDQLLLALGGEHGGEVVLEGRRGVGLGWGGRLRLPARGEAQQPGGEATQDERSGGWRHASAPWAGRSRRGRISPTREATRTTYDGRPRLPTGGRAPFPSSRRVP